MAGAERTVSVRYEPLVLLEHVNINIEKWTDVQHQFWTEVLGGVEDARTEEVKKKAIEGGSSYGDLRWINFGLQQFHIPLRDSVCANQRLRGVTCLLWPLSSRERLLDRIEKSGQNVIVPDWISPLTLPSSPSPSIPTPICVEEPVMKNRFRLEFDSSPPHSSGKSEIVAPVGGVVHGSAHLPGGVTESLGIKYVEMWCRKGTAARIGSFYEHLFGAQVVVSEDGALAEVMIGSVQSLKYREVPDSLYEEYDGHHIAIYINHFEEAYDRAAKLGYVYSNPRYPNLAVHTKEDAVRLKEFRLLDICDPATGEKVFQLEHEIRALSHPGFEQAAKCIRSLTSA